MALIPLRAQSSASRAGLHPARVTYAIPEQQRTGGYVTSVLHVTQVERIGSRVSGCRIQDPQSGLDLHGHSPPLGAQRGGRGYTAGPFMRKTCAIPKQQKAGGHEASVSHVTQVEGTGAGGIGYKPDCQRTPDSFPRRHNTPIYRYRVDVSSSRGVHTNYGYFSELEAGSSDA